MNKIVQLWAVPRSTSTAFEWMMRQRGDMNCLHEPYGEAWYQGEFPLSPRPDPNNTRKKGLTLESVTESLKKAAGEGAVFSKDFPHYIKDIWDDELLSLFTHSFLIRDPAKTITSLYKNWPDVYEEEIGFPEQRELFDIIAEKQGIPPPVIDSDDLLEDPHNMVEKWCRAVDIPFIKESLSWEPGGDPSAHSWWDGGVFHKNLANSRGLTPQPRTKHIDIKEAPDRVREIHEKMLPHYEHLYKYRIKPA